MKLLSLLSVIGLAFFLTGTSRGASAGHAGAAAAKAAQAAAPKAVSLVDRLKASSPELRQLGYAAMARLTEPELEALRLELTRPGNWDAVKDNLVSDLDVRRFQTREAAHKAFSLIGCLAQSELSKFRDSGPVETQRHARRLLDEFDSQLVFPYEELQRKWVEALRESGPTKLTAQVLGRLEKKLPANWANHAKQMAAKVADAEQELRAFPDPTGDKALIAEYEALMDKRTAVMNEELALYVSAATAAGFPTKPLPPPAPQIPFVVIEHGDRTFRLAVEKGQLRIAPVNTAFREEEDKSLFKLPTDAMPARMTRNGCEGPAKLENGVTQAELRAVQFFVSPELGLSPDRRGEYELMTGRHRMLGLDGVSGRGASDGPPARIIHFAFFEDGGPLPKVTDRPGEPPVPDYYEKLRWINAR